MKLRLIYESITKEQVIKAVSNYVRKIAKLKSAGADRNEDYDAGLVSRFTKADEDDLKVS